MVLPLVPAPVPALSGQHAPLTSAWLLPALRERCDFAATYGGAVDDGVDDPVESHGRQGINGRCPVDDGSFSGRPGQRPCVLGGRGGKTASPLKKCSSRRRLRRRRDPGNRGPGGGARGRWQSRGARQPGHRPARAARRDEAPPSHTWRGLVLLCGVTERAVRYGAPDSPVGLLPGPYPRQTAAAVRNAIFGHGRRENTCRFDTGSGEIGRGAIHLAAGPRKPVRHRAGGAAGTSCDGAWPAGSHPATQAIPGRPRPFPGGPGAAMVTVSRRMGRNPGHIHGESARPGGPGPPRVFSARPSHHGARLAVTLRA